MLGGLLTNPAKTMPGLFGGVRFFEHYPYFLPCFVSSLFSLVGFAMGWLYLEETKKLPQSHEHVSPAEEQCLLAANQSKSSATLSQVITRSVIYSVLPFSAISFVQVIFDEVFSLWSSTSPKDGGLSFKSKEIGVALSYIGVMGLVTQSLIFPFAQRHFGTVPCYKYAMLLYSVTFLLLPNVSSVALNAEQGRFSPEMVWVALLSVLTLRVLSASFAFTSSMILVRNKSFIAMNKLFTLCR
jgi:hypothetical protein